MLELLGSDSQVTAPLNLRMYLYSKLVLAGSVTVTVKCYIRVDLDGRREIIYHSRLDSLRRRVPKRCPETSSSGHQATQ